MDATDIDIADDIAELCEVKAAEAAAARKRAKAAAARKRQTKKDTKEQQRRLAAKERDVRIAERRKIKQKSNYQANLVLRGHSRRAALAHSPLADKKTSKKAAKKRKDELARAPELLQKLREGQARIDALAAKVGHASIGK